MLSYFNKFKNSFVLNEYYYIDEEYNNINNIFLREIEHTKYDKQNYTQITKIYNSRNTSKINNDEKYICDIANKYLTECGLKQNTNYFAIEYWRHRLFGENTYHKFSVHKDSFGILYDAVNTCIFYLRKDRTFNGGDLEIYGKKSIFISNKSLRTIKPNNNILCFDGDVYHKVTDFSGFGIRDCIVVQFAKDESLLNFFS